MRFHLHGSGLNFLIKYAFNYVLTQVKGKQKLGFKQFKYKMIAAHILPRVGCNFRWICWRIHS